MTSQPSTQPPPADPAALPLFADPPARPGRIRGDFSLRPAAAGPAVVDELRRLRAVLHTAPTTPALTGVDTPIDWDLVRAFRTVVAGRLTAAQGGAWRQDATTAAPFTPRRAV